MIAERPTVYLLCGIAGSGKTTYAGRLMEQGVSRLSIEDGVAEFGRPGTDFPVEDYAGIEREVLARQKTELAGRLAVGGSVALDYGFKWRRQRDEYKEFAKDNGGDWRLLYFRASREVLWRRLEIRNQTPGVNAVPVSQELLGTFIEWFEEPDGEGEEIIDAV